MSDMPTPENDAAFTGKKDNTWVYALVVVCIGLFGSAAAGHGASSTNIGYLIGYYLPVALIAWAIFSGIFLRRRDEVNKAIIFGVIWGALFLGGLGSTYIHHAQQERVLDNIGNAIDHAYKETSGETTSGYTPPAPVSGEIGQAQKWVLGLINKMVALNHSYLREMQAIGLQDLLNAQRLQHDTGLKKSMSILQKAKKLVTQYRSRTYQIIDQGRKQIDQLPVSEATKEEMKRGFDKGLGTSSKQLKRTWDLEYQAVVEQESIINLLGRSRWTASGNKILFYNNTDLLQFKRYVNQLAKIDQEETKIRESSYARTKYSFDSVRGAAR